MLDIKKIKENPDAVKAGLKAKEVDCDATVDRILELDERIRALKTASEGKTAQKNKLSKETGKLFGQKKKAEREGTDTSAIEAAIAEHRADPGRRTLQKLLAEEVTRMVHGQAELDNAIRASQMLFGKATADDLRSLDEKTFLAVFDGVPTFDVPKDKLPVGILDFLAVETQVFPSKAEARKMIQGNGFSINKEKMNDISREVGQADIIDGKYILVQKGKKDYYIINVK